MIIRNSRNRKRGLCEVLEDNPLGSSKSEQAGPSPVSCGNVLTAQNVAPSFRCGYEWLNYGNCIKPESRNTWGFHDVVACRVIPLCSRVGGYRCYITCCLRLQVRKCLGGVGNDLPHNTVSTQKIIRIRNQMSWLAVDYLFIMINN
jgi:hypothetical protein